MDWGATYSREDHMVGMALRDLALGRVAMSDDASNFV